jgi:hypothetical protein
MRTLNAHKYRSEHNASGLCAAAAFQASCSKLCRLATWKRIAEPGRLSLATAKEDLGDPCESEAYQAD